VTPIAEAIWGYALGCRRFNELTAPMNNPPGNKKAELTRILPNLAPWMYPDRDSASVGAALSLSAGGAIGGVIAWLGYPLLGGLAGAVLLMLLLRAAPHQ
jgi:hypothetical protein